MATGTWLRGRGGGRVGLFAFTLAAGISLLLIACSSGGGSSIPSGVATNVLGTSSPPAGGTPSTSPEEALALYVQRRLSQGFVANCDDAKRPDDVGKQCAERLGERSGLIAFKLGPTFGEYTRIMILKFEAGVWTIARQETHDPNDPEVPGIPWPLAVNAEVVVAGTAPDCLKIREQPAITGRELNCIDDGTKARVVAGPQQSNEIEWWQLEGLGWAAGNYLRYADSDIPEFTPTPEG